jgi:hypothetical protein
LTGGDERADVYTGSHELEVFIERPVADVWKQFLDVGSWVTSHLIEEISEPRRTLGAITRVSGADDDPSQFEGAPYHYCKIVKLVPERQYLLKTYSEEGPGGSYGMEIVAFDDARFIDVDGSTRVVFNLYAHFKGEIIARNPGLVDLESSAQGMLGNLQKLKQVLEA